MLITGMTKEQVIDTISENLCKAGVYNDKGLLGYRDTLAEYDDINLTKALVHSHELKEVATAAQELRSRQKPPGLKGRLMSKLTGMLRPAHVARGYMLTEDEDFLFLYMPDQKMPPIVFNARTTTLPDVIKTICRLEGEDDR